MMVANEAQMLRSARPVGKYVTINLKINAETLLFQSSVAVLIIRA